MDTIKFLIKFFFIFFIFSIFLELIDFYFFSNFLTFIIANYMNLSYFNHFIFINEQIFVVSRYCLGLMSVAMLASIIFALDKPNLIQKTKIFLFGGLTLIIINVFRVAFILILAKQGFDADLTHSITWGIMSIFVIILWYYITRLVAGKITF